MRQESQSESSRVRGSAVLGPGGGSPLLLPGEPLPPLEGRVLEAPSRLSCLVQSSPVLMAKSVVQSSLVKSVLSSLVLSCLRFSSLVWSCSVQSCLLLSCLVQSTVDVTKVRFTEVKRTSVTSRMYSTCLHSCLPSSRHAQSCYVLLKLVLYTLWCCVVMLSHILRH